MPCFCEYVGRVYSLVREIQYTSYHTIVDIKVFWFTLCVSNFDINNLFLYQFQELSTVPKICFAYLPRKCPQFSLSVGSVNYGIIVISLASESSFSFQCKDFRPRMKHTRSPGSFSRSFNALSKQENSHLTFSLYTDFKVWESPVSKHL